MKPIIVAEIGINHNASFMTLIELTDMALGAGADYVKLQVRNPEVCVPREYWDTPKLWFDGEVVSYIEYRRRMELPFYGDSKGLAEYDQYVTAAWGRKRWFASVWDQDSLESVAEFEPPFVKIPSAMITNIELLKATADSRIPVILSTGMSTWKEIDAAINTFRADHDLTILHCNSAYPTDDKEVNLMAMLSLERDFGAIYCKGISSRYSTAMVDAWPTQRKFGFSSHSKSPFPAIYSMVMGAYMVEVHVTLDRAMQGGDHGASLEEPGLKLLTRERDRIPVLMGDGKIQLYKSELPARKKLRGND